MPSTTDRFQEAVIFAVRLHANQLRKATDIPYVSHLFSVAALAMEHGATEDEAIAALLHDAVEDQGGKPTLEEIRRRFGDHVASIVDGCTDTDQHPKPPWRERKQAYIDHVHHASPSVCLVSACDKLHNSRCILSDVRVEGDAAFKKFTGSKDGTLWYYRSLVNGFAGKIPKRLADELERVVSELERLSSDHQTVQIIV
ncbi:MAG TPA: HD domain-containing protein [Humisphaera sp.]|nr:HD domain-containing protein [Humisphaera sp.]